MAETDNVSSAYESETFGKDASFHLDEPVGSASISPCGRDVVLASREGLHIIDLDSPYAPPRHLVHRTPWAVADVQWSPFASRSHWVVSTSNQKALVWNLSMVNRYSSVENVLHGHKRAITDINFSAHHPDILATCAVDSYVLCWDLRVPYKPALAFCDWFAGATQVKWNRQDLHVIASSHDKYLKLWDDRNGATPLRTIEAHSTKIYGVDWDRYNSRRLATCSLDRTIKLWDLDTDSNQPHETIFTGFPVWRARHTPFGHGILALPQRGDHDLHLYDERQEFAGENKISSSVFQFSGHRDNVKEFLWRPRGPVTQESDEREFQLVSWGMDRLLRLHKVEDDVLTRVGFVRGMRVNRPLNLTRRGAEYVTFRDQPHTAREEGVVPREQNNGTIGMSIPMSAGYGSEGFMSAVTSLKRTTQKTMDPVSWMRGVKIGDRARSPTAPGDATANADSTEMKIAQAWDTFESLGEEVSHALDKFPRVKVEDIDVQRRRLLVGLAGPWAPNRSHVPFRCRFDFPSTYPSTASPVFNLEKGNAMSEEVAKHIAADVEELSIAFLAYGRHCLEASLRVLLGEQTLEESLKVLGNSPSLEEVGMDIEEPFESSSDEDDELGTEALPYRNSLESSDPNIALRNSHQNVPAPRTCAAVWGKGGRLACFFPGKQEKDSTLLHRRLNAEDRRGRDLFESFGRFGALFQQKKSPGSLLDSTELIFSEADEEWESSSESSVSTIVDLYQGAAYPLTSMPFIFGTDKPYESIVDQSQRSVGDAEHRSLSASKAGTSISLYDYAGELPFESGLAENYLIGRGADIAQYNANVCMHENFQALANVWSWIDTMLSARRLYNATKPLQDAPDTHRMPDTSEERSSKFNQKMIAADIWILDSIVKYFWTLGDNQTLAMVTCVLDVDMGDSLTSNQSDDTTTLDRALNRKPSFVPSEELFVDADPAHRSRSTSFATAESQLYSHPIPTGQNHIDKGRANSMLPTPASVTPPYARSFGRSSSGKILQQMGFSVSPDENGSVHRRSSNNSSFTASFPKILSMGYSASSSPPDRRGRRHRASTGKRKASTGLEKSIESRQSSEPDITTTQDNMHPHNRSPKSRQDATTRSSVSVPEYTSDIKFNYLNEDQFSLATSHNARMLPSYDETICEGWRDSYADILGSWGMWRESAQILKFNRHHSSATKQSTTALESLELERQRRHTCCVLCNELILGLASPCLNCGHTVHTACRDEQLIRATDGDTGAELTCASGCGCTCQSYQAIDLPTRQSHARDASAAATSVRM